jgi:hypothetical protein
MRLTSGFPAQRCDFNELVFPRERNAICPSYLPRNGIVEKFISAMNLATAVIVAE